MTSVGLAQCGGHIHMAWLAQEWNPKEHKSTVAVSAGNKVRRLSEYGCCDDAGPVE